MKPSRQSQKMLLIGEHDKGTGEPFSLTTMSGRRIRGLIEQLELPTELTNMMRPGQNRPSKRQIGQLLRKHKAFVVTVFLGRKVEKELREHIPYGVYLPHPAARARTHREQLRRGLMQLRKEMN